jgi:hypothetical protein
MKCPEFIHENRLLPSFFNVVMNYPHNGIQDVEKKTGETLERVLRPLDILKGQRVAVGVGSRNITFLPVLVKAVCDRIKKMGAVPVIVPAMGSHGGAESQGQVKVLESLGITAESCGAEVFSNMDVVKLDTVLDDVPVYFSKDAMAMDHSVVINRIKPHTKFKGDVESGIYKMMCIGMGKHEGAAALHQASLRHGFSKVIRAAGECVLSRSNIRFALAVVENQHDEPVEIKAVSAKDIFSEERRMLVLAKEHFPRLPFKNIDVLVIRKIGKDISGSGMDPNVTGRAYDLMEDDFSGILSVKRIVLLDLSEKSGGNAIGLGNADIITEKLFRKMDYRKTMINALTSTSLRKAFIPPTFDDDENAMMAAFSTCGIKNLDTIRAVIINDTRHVTDFWVSPALVEELKRRNDVMIRNESALKFSDRGDLVFFK